MSEVETGLHYPLKLDELPESWSVGYVGDFAETVQPGFASGKHNKGGAGIPHLRPMNVDQDGKVSMNEVKYVSPEKDRKRLQPGDVLFNNTNSPVWVGKTAYIALADDLAFSNHMTRVVFGGGVSPKFGALQLHYLWMTGYFLHRCTKHVNQASISSKTLADTVPFVVPDSRDTQDRIVAEIEKQFSRLDEAVASLKRVKANLKRYKAAALKAAVEGKLTEEWRKQNPDVEPASKLLERILAERRTKWEEAELAKMKAKGKEPKDDKWKEKYKECLAVEPKELEDLPEGYIVVPLDALCSQIGDVDHKMPKKQEQGIPYISTKDFLDNGDIDFDKAKLIREEDYVHLCRKIYPEQNDVLLSRYGTVGEVRLVATDRKFQASYSVAIIKPVVSEISGYLAMVLQTHPLQKQIKKHTRSTAQPDLGLGHIREFEIPIPPLSEQEKIMEEVDDRVSLFNRLESEIELATIKASHARQSILTQAFNGRLSDMGGG